MIVTLFLNGRQEVHIIQNKLIQGTLLLTIAGFVTRLIGFIYRIFLADILGTHLLGVYQLVFPVYSICFTIYGAGIQTAISQLIASNVGTDCSKKEKDFTILKYGLLASLTLSLTLTFSIYTFSEPIAEKLLLEPSCAPYLKILCLLFPFCGTAACINGYFYGKEKAKVPAITQIIEQLFRVFSVVILCSVLSVTPKLGCSLAVVGLVIGEAASCFYNCYQLYCSVHACPKKRTDKLQLDIKKTASTLLFLAFTLTTTKLVISVLHSIEAVFIPAALRKFGCSASDALSIYGILSGIALPFILFPSTMTNSFAVMLLPAIAQAHAGNRENSIRKYVTISCKYSLLIGYLFTCLFLLFGKDFGTVIFHSKDAGIYICVLSWLCPFLYLSTTFTSIINGLGKTQFTFIITIVSMMIKIYFLIVLVPQHGIQAYLVGSLISQIAMTLLEGVFLRNYLLIEANKFFIIPGISLTVSGYICQKLYHMLPAFDNHIITYLTLGGSCLIICLIYISILFITGCINRKDWERNIPSSYSHS